MVEDKGTGGLTNSFESNGEAATTTHIVTPVDGEVVVDSAELLFVGEFERSGDDLSISYRGETQLIIDYFGSATPPSVSAPNGAFLSPQAINSLAGDPVAGRYAQLAGGEEPLEIGRVLKLDGSATSTSISGVTKELSVGDPVFQGDVLETGGGSKLGISFVDKTLFSMSADARMILDELIYDPANVENSSMSLNLVQGAFVFVTGEIAPTGNMNVDTPVATMGIRGTAPRVAINAAVGSAVFTIIQEPGKDHFGEYVVINRITGEIMARIASPEDKWVVTNVNDAVKIIKSGADYLEDKIAYDDIADMQNRSRGGRGEIDGSNNFPRVTVNLDVADLDLADLDAGDDALPDGAELLPHRIFTRNLPPIASDDVITGYDRFVIGGGGTQDIVYADNGSGVDIDPEGGPLIVTEINGQALNFIGDTASVLLPSGAILLVARDGGITYDPNGVFSFPKGVTGQDTFDYTIQDEVGLVDFGSVTIDIIGTGDNKPPVITTITDVSETLPETDTALVTSGSFDVEDVDDIDTVVVDDVTVIATGNGAAALAGLPDDTALLAMFDPLSAVVILPGDTTGTVTWTFNSGLQPFNYLAVGENVSLTYTITVDDAFFGMDQQDVVINIIGTNDRPSIVASASPGADNVETLIETDSFLATSGSFTVSDVDVTDLVSSKVTGVVASSTTDGVVDAVANTNGQNFSNLLTLDTSLILNSGETSDILTWNFKSATAGQFDYLARGEFLQLVYTIQVDDLNNIANPSGSDDEPSKSFQTVTIIIDGSNDQPTIAAATSASADNKATLVETDVILITSGNFKVEDLDVTDEVTSTVVNLVASSTTDGVADAHANTNSNNFFNLLTLNTPQILENGETSDTLVWTFESASATQFDYLARGEILTLIFTVEINDQNNVNVVGSSGDELSKTYQTVTINIVGTNDQPGAGDGDVGTNERPVIIVADNNETFTEDDGIHTASGQFAVVDFDTSDVLTAQLNALTPILTAVDPSSSVSINGSGNVVIMGTGTDTRTITNAQLKNMFTLRDESNDGTDGPATSGHSIQILDAAEVTDALYWDFDSGSETFDFLAAGESLMITVELEVFDDNLLAAVPDPAPDEPSSSFETITILIEGTNDQPSIIVIDQNEILIEDDGEHFTAGAFAVADIDTTDVLTAQLNTVTPVLTAVDPASSVSINSSGDVVIMGTGTDARSISNGQLKNMFTLLDKTTDGTTGPLDAGHVIEILGNAETADTLHWEFDSGGETFDFLAAGESLTVTVQVEVFDDNVFAAEPDPSPDEPSSSFETITIIIRGTNDQPTIDVVDNKQTFTENDGPHLTTGTYDVADIDTTDVLTAKLNTVTPGVTALDPSSSITVNASGDVVVMGTDGDERTIQNSTLKSMFALRDATSDGTAGPLANGHTIQILGSTETADTLHWDFDSGEETFDFLALGETLTLTVAVEVVDDNAFPGSPNPSPDEPSSTFQMITIVIEGTNDQPNIFVAEGDVAGGARTETDGVLTRTGSLTVHDIDSSDIVDASVTNVEAIYGRPDGEDSSSPVSMVQGPSGDTIVVQRDGHPDGDNTIDNATLLNFMKLADVAGASSQPGDFLTNQNVQILGDGETNDVLHWQFNSSTPVTGSAELVEAFEFLAENETLHLTYTIRVKDDSGQGDVSEQEWDEQTVVILITGTNDQPDITGYVQPVAIAETDGALAQIGALAVGDVDSSDVVNVRVTSVDAKVDGLEDSILMDELLLGFLTLTDASSNQTKTASQTQASALQVLADGEVLDQLNWDFASTPTAFDYLTLGETLTITYDVVVDDQNGVEPTESSTRLQQIVVTVTGTNDEPVIDAISNAAVDESIDGSPISVSIGEVTFEDVDLNDVGHTATISNVIASGETGGLTATNEELIALIEDLGVTKLAGTDSGSLTPTFTAPASVFGYLTFGQMLILTYTLQIDDGDGGLDSENFAVTITGVNSPPDLSDPVGDPLLAYAQGDGAQIIFPNVAISDDGTTIQSAQVQITNFDTNTDILGFVAQSGISGSYDASTGILSLSGSASLGEYETALQSITFSTGASLDISTVSREISFTVNDGVSSSEPITTSVGMTAAESDPANFTVIPGSGGGGDKGEIIGTSGNDKIENSSEFDEIFGGDGNDILVGVQIGDILYGEGGNDFLLGGQGKDTLDGGIGNDILIGGLGADTLIGGDGSDQFVFDSTGADDTVLDFTLGEDFINIDALDATVAQISFSGDTDPSAEFVVELMVKNQKIADLTISNPEDFSTNPLVGIQVIYDSSLPAEVFTVPTA